MSGGAEGGPVVSSVRVVTLHAVIDMVRSRSPTWRTELHIRPCIPVLSTLMERAPDCGATHAGVCGAVVCSRGDLAGSRSKILP